MADPAQSLNVIALVLTATAFALYVTAYSSKYWIQSGDAHAGLWVACDGTGSCDDVTSFLVPSSWGEGWVVGARATLSLGLVCLIASLAVAAIPVFVASLQRHPAPGFICSCTIFSTAMWGMIGTAIMGSSVSNSVTSLASSSPGWCLSLTCVSLVMCLGVVAIHQLNFWVTFSRPAKATQKDKVRQQRSRQLSHIDLGTPGVDMGASHIQTPHMPSLGTPRTPAPENVYQNATDIFTVQTPDEWNKTSAQKVSPTSLPKHFNRRTPASCSRPTLYPTRVVRDDEGSPAGDTDDEGYSQIKENMQKSVHDHRVDDSFTAYKNYTEQTRPSVSDRPLSAARHSPAGYWEIQGQESGARRSQTRQQHVGVSSSDDDDSC